MALDLAANGTAAGWVFPWETPPLTREWFMLMGCAGGCVCTAALAAGLTMGMLSIEPFSLHLTEATDLADCATPELRRFSEKPTSRPMISTILYPFRPLEPAPGSGEKLRHAFSL